MHIAVCGHVLPIELFYRLIFPYPGATDMQMSGDGACFGRMAYRPQDVTLVDEGGTAQISVELSVAVDGVQDSVFPADLRVLNIEGFSQKITMKMNRMSGEDRRDQHLRQDIAYFCFNILGQVNVNAFMGAWPRFSPPPLLGVVEQHAGQKKKTRDLLQVIQLHKEPEKRVWRQGCKKRRFGKTMS